MSKLSQKVGTKNWEQKSENKNLLLNQMLK